MIAIHETAQEIHNENHEAVGFYEALDAINPQTMMDVNLPTPTPKKHDLLVEVEAISIPFGHNHTCRILASH